MPVRQYLEDSNTDAIQYLREVALQHKCRFSLTLIRNPLDQLSTGGVSTGVKVFNTLVNTAGAVADVLITRYLIESIQFPGGINFEYERVNGKRHVKNIVYPDTVTMVFRETQDGLVRRYLTEWIQSIATPYRPKDTIAALNPFRGLLPNSRLDPREGTYEFADNMDAAKRTGILFLKPDDNSAPKYPRYMFYGLTIQDQPTYDVAQDAQDYLTHSVTFSVDEVKTPLLL